MDSSPSIDFRYPSTVDWTAALANIANSSKSGRKYVYLNGGNQVAIFTDKSDAYGKKLSFHEICEITEHLMQKCSDENLKSSMAMNLNTLKSQKKRRFSPGEDSTIDKRISISSCSTAWNSNKEQKPVEQESSTSSVFNYEVQGNLDKDSNVTLEIFSDVSEVGAKLKETEMEKTLREAKLEEDIKKATSMNRSIDGTNGVYSFDVGRERILLKMEPEPNKHKIADNFFKLFGFKTPNYRVVLRDSDAGKAILEKCDELKEKCFNSLLERKTRATAKAETNPEQVDIATAIGAYENQIKDRDFLVMDYINDATTFADSMPDNFLNDLNNPKFLSALGEVIFFDAVIGNNDRIGIDGSNISNIMIREDAVGEGKERIVLIDHDFKFSASKLEDYKTTAEQILLLNKTNEIVEEFLAGFNDVETEDGIMEFSECAKPKLMCEHINRGILFAAQALVKTFNSEENVKSLGELSEADFKAFLELVQSIKEQIKEKTKIGDLS